MDTCAYDIDEPRFEPIETVDLDPCKIRLMASNHGVVKLSQPLENPSAFWELVQSLGTPMFTTGETPVGDLPMLNVVSNVGRAVAPKSAFHSDTSCVQRPPSYSALFALEVPQQGGATLFTDQYEAAERLPRGLKEVLKNASVLHGATGVDDATETLHPLFRKHPVTKRFALYLSSPGRMKQLRPRINTRARDRILTLLHQRSIRLHVKYRHEWAPGDVVVWDNRCTLHAADHSQVVGDRVLYRGMVQGETPFWG
jgi:taurine dioxygenase